MTDNYLEMLRKRVIEQQQKVDSLIENLYAHCHYSEQKVRPFSIGSQEILPPKNFAELKKNYEQFIQQSSDTYLSDIPLWLAKEKESPSAILIKLSQMLLKWAELELAIVKELKRSTEEEMITGSNLPLNETEMDILREYLLKP